MYLSSQILAAQRWIDYEEHGDYASENDYDSKGEGDGEDEAARTPRDVHPASPART